MEVIRKVRWRQRGSPCSFVPTAARVNKKSKPFGLRSSFHPQSVQQLNYAKAFSVCFKARGPWLPHHCQPTLHAKYSPYLKYLPINHRHKLSHLMDAGYPQSASRWFQNSKRLPWSPFQHHPSCRRLSIFSMPFRPRVYVLSGRHFLLFRPNDHLRASWLFEVAAALLLCYDFCLLPRQQPPRPLHRYASRCRF